MLPENALVAIVRRPQPGRPPQPVLFGTVARRNPKDLAAEHPVVGLAFTRGQAEEAARLLAAMGRFPGCLEAEGYVLVQVGVCRVLCEESLRHALACCRLLCASYLV